MSEILKWIWRLLFLALVISLFISDVGKIQIALIIGIIVLRVIIVDNDKTVY